MDYLTGRFDNVVIHIFEPREAVNRKSREWGTPAISGKLWGLNKVVGLEKKHPGWGAGDTNFFIPVFPFITQDTNIKCSILVSEIFTILAFDKWS